MQENVASKSPLNIYGVTIMSNKKKILIVNDLLYGGGVEKLMYDLVMHWHEKYDITVMTFEYCEGFEENYPDDVKYISTPKKMDDQNGRIWRRAFSKFVNKVTSKLFFKHLAKKRYDVILSLKEGWVMKGVAWMENAPVKYCWVHTDYNNYYYTKQAFGSAENEIEAMENFDGIICVAESIKQSIIDVIGDPGNLMVKYNPIDSELIYKKAAELVDDIDVSKKDGFLRFITVGRLNRQKGYDMLLEACHMLENDGLKFEVWVIGAEEPWGDEHEWIYRAQKRMNVQSVKFLGGRKNPYKYMKYGDWFLSSSMFEGYSLVSQESALLDVPQLLTDCSGVRELLGDSDYGIVTEISVLGIYEGMKKVIEHPELRDYYKQKIAERKKIITFDERINEIEKLIK